MEPDPCAKKDQIETISKRWHANELATTPTEIVRVREPGRPEKLVLVAPRKLLKRKISTNEGRAVIVHAVTHIEFNAINLALDALYRFQDQPKEYYSDWLLVATEEAYHCNLMIERLAQLGYNYGDFPAHNGLWEMAVSTDHSFLDRMGMVPRVFEARGLDVTPGMIERFRGVGDQETIDCLEIILRDEVGHVAIGNKWFEFACQAQGVDVIETFQHLIRKYMNGQVRGPFHTEARLAAGFSQKEMDLLEKM